MGKKGGGKPPHAAVGASVAGGVSKPTSSKGKLSGDAKSGPPTTSAKDSGDFDLDALFSKGKAAKAKVDAAAAAAEAARVEKEGPKEKDRVLLPGQKKKKQKREAPEFVPVSEPRRFEDGLPVYKSYGDFSDVSPSPESARSTAGVAFEAERQSGARRRRAAGSTSTRGS
jgi:hypothetical protein